MRTVAAVLIALIFSGCLKERITPNGNKIEELRDVKGFTGINNSGSTKIYVKYGEVYEVKLKGSSNLVSNFESELIGSTLNLGYRKGSVRDADLEVFITTPELKKIQLNGSGDVIISGSFPLGERLDTGISGSGDIVLTGAMRFNFFDADISGSGKMNLASLEAKNADVSISGSGDVNVAVVEKLDVRISGSGKVYYSGNPTVNSNVSGSGKVIRL